MNRKLLNFAQRYQATLRTHLKAGLRASLEAARGLGTEALHTFLKSFREQTGIRVSFSAFTGVEEEMNGDKRIVLYRVAQEALTNVARHAQVSQAQVNIQKLNFG